MLHTITVKKRLWKTPDAHHSISTLEHTLRGPPRLHHRIVMPGLDTVERRAVESRRMRESRAADLAGESHPPLGQHIVRYRTRTGQPRSVADAIACCPHDGRSSAQCEELIRGLTRSHDHALAHSLALPLRQQHDADDVERVSKVATYDGISHRLCTTHHRPELSCLEMLLHIVCERGSDRHCEPRSSEPRRDRDVERVRRNDRDFLQHGHPP